MEDRARAGGDSHHRARSPPGQIWLLPLRPRGGSSPRNSECSVIAQKSFFFSLPRAGAGLGPSQPREERRAGAGSLFQAASEQHLELEGEEGGLRPGPPQVLSLCGQPVLHMYIHIYNTWKLHPSSNGL